MQSPPDIAVDDALHRITALRHGAPIALALVDADARYVRVNEPLAALHGLTAGDHVGRRAHDLFPWVADEFDAILAELDGGAPVVPRVVRTTRPDGSALMYVLIAFGVSGVAGGRGVAALLLDVSDLAADADAIAAKVLQLALLAVWTPEGNLGAVLDAHATEFRAWAAGGPEPALVDELRHGLRPERVVHWLHRRNGILDGERPIDRLRDGDVDGVLGLLRATD